MLKQASQVLNKIMAVLTGLFLSAILFLVILKLLGGWGIGIALVIGFLINFWLYKKYRKTSSNLFFLNIGLFSFNLLTTITGLIAYIVFFSAMQNLLK